MLNFNLRFQELYQRSLLSNNIFLTISSSLFYEITNALIIFFKIKLIFKSFYFIFIMKIIYNILLSLVSISVQQSSAYNSSVKICQNSSITDRNNCSSADNLQVGVICCQIRTLNNGTACVATFESGLFLASILASTTKLQCSNNYLHNTTSIKSAASCSNTAPKNVIDCTSLSANGVACCFQRWKTYKTFITCLPMYSNETKYLLNNNQLTPGESISWDCGTFGTLSIPTNTPFYADGTNTTLNGNGGVMLFNFLILIFMLLLV